MSLGSMERQDRGLWGALAALRRALAPADHLALWTLTIDGAVAGSLMREGGEYRLSLFEASENDLTDLLHHAADPEALEGALSERLGGEVRLHPVAG